MSNPQVIHSAYSFSGRKRWSTCPISIHMSKGMADSSGPAAAEGTCAHAVAEFYVCQHFTLAHAHDITQPEAPMQVVPEGLDLKGKTSEQWNDELRRHGKAYRDFVISLIPPGEEHYVVVEQKVSIPSISPQLFGTADLIVWLPSLGLLIVVDYKYGFESVDVGTIDDTNPQLGAYLVAAEEGLMQRQIVPQAGMVAVYQPRRILQRPEQTLSVDRAWFGRERNKLAAEVAAIEQNPGEPRPGDHCRYCKAKPRCPAVHNALRTALEAHCGNKSVLDMPEDQLIQLFAAKRAFEALIEDVTERVKKLAEAGHANLQIKESKGRRMWGDVPLATQTFLALGRADLLQPRALSDVTAEVPEAFLGGLVKMSAPSRSIEVVDAKEPTAIAKMFADYVKKD